MTCQPPAIGSALFGGKKRRADEKAGELVEQRVCVGGYVTGGAQRRCAGRARTLGAPQSTSRAAHTRLCLRQLRALAPPASGFPPATAAAAAASMDHESANGTVAGNGTLGLAPPLNTTSDEDELYQVPVEIIVLLSFCYGLISLVAVAGNSMVLWIVATSRRMQTVTNFFIANLAVADIIIGLFSIPFQFQAALLQRWVLPEFMCAFCPFVQVLSVNVSIFTLTAIALDRYRAVTAPLRARCCSKFNAKVLIGVVWAVSTAAALPYALALRVILVYDSVSGEISRPFCINVVLPPFAWKVYNHVLVGLQYFLPLCVICYTYGRIGGAVRNSRTPGNAETVRDTNIIRNKRKVFASIELRKPRPGSNTRRSAHQPGPATTVPLRVTVALNPTLFFELAAQMVTAKLNGRDHLNFAMAIIL
ncbi:hypothetical protein HPB51_024650 [Rhipicephalus microplus]|uniref:G-protein coupled receptors family 1 profile domain-containing protein n=1 Tax=Rhipicephalus microplus TaxID=6941 RepID=A0A9J6EJN4_RHIMP|nr:hypothetical protein HPB51_024650 [Rhipicephalus microplus]